MDAGCGEGGRGGGGRDERVPQWGAQETRELIATRREMEREAAVTARRSAKTMWEAVSARLRERGYRRTADQCKCKWKNLVNRYKVPPTAAPFLLCFASQMSLSKSSPRAATLWPASIQPALRPSLRLFYERTLANIGIRWMNRSTSGRVAMEGKPLLHPLLSHPRLPVAGLVPNHPNRRRLPASRFLLGDRSPKPKARQLGLALRHRPSHQTEKPPSRGGWDWWAPRAAAGLVLHLAVCSVLLLFPTHARACVGALPPPPAGAVEAAEEEDDEEWKVALQQWKSKTYSLSVPLRVVALRGSFPPAWIKDFVETQGKRLKLSPEFRTSLEALFSEMSQCLDKGQLQPKSAMAADVVSIGDSWLGYAISKGLVEPVKNAEEQDWFRNLSNRWKIHLCRNHNGEVDPNGSIWAVPYRWGTMVIAYKKNKFKRHNLKPIQDWEDLWRPELAGKISMVDSPREVIGAVLKYLGSSYNINDMESEIIGGRETVLENLTQLQKQVQLFDSMNYLKSFGVGDVWVAVGWSSDVIPAAKRMSNVAVVVPKSGSSLWADLWAIPSATKFQTDRIGGRTRGPSPLIHQWFDFCLQSARSLPFRQDVIPGASPLFLENPVPEVPQEQNKRKPKLDTNLARGAPPLEILEKCEFLEPLSEKALDDYQWLISRMQRPNRGLFGILLQNISSLLNFKSRV
ncbi:hypothetical protein E2562_014871 [Oryza meyeriana var. granulata]|uniref:Myb-like domain-containing protein n=1 Tax=Oryza meyeriana var. granulata TaxID=110450 RepID=A0A6G1BWF5_9ORYZ|nr:hypothetical protein E2562_014871 [Oryza meyeriana var. granulata]